MLYRTSMSFPALFKSIHAEDKGTEEVIATSASSLATALGRVKRCGGAYRANLRS